MLSSILPRLPLQPTSLKASHLLRSGPGGILFEDVARHGFDTHHLHLPRPVHAERADGEGPDDLVLKVDIVEKTARRDFFLGGQNSKDALRSRLVDSDSRRAVGRERATIHFEAGTHDRRITSASPVGIDSLRAAASCDGTGKDKKSAADYPRDLHPRLLRVWITTLAFSSEAADGEC